MVEALPEVILEVPLWQMVLLLVILLSCHAIGRNTLGILTAVTFMMYWGYIYNFDKFFHHSHPLDSFTLGFIITGAVNILIITILFIHSFSLKD